MRRIGSYALITTYLVVQLFGQAIHAWSGCEHAHLPGLMASHATLAHHGACGQADDHGHRHLQVADTHCNLAQPGQDPGWNAGHQHRLTIDGCLLCQHLTLGQIAPTTTHLVDASIPLESLVLQSSRPTLNRWLGPNSPRAPPVA
ncbi:hypothetical protein DTL42_07360 [Bremerella cremea]|uniref:DUF2946 domain-containing protein n=1 Tax=Bremerella cremea TaxID=1031537 RepID=A0A368KWA6_9BACT|nr:hypothetical protein [Bremerella cremea]RCS52649.1 hypothetical protein DTL42_07360 [Bremerella cremea]